MKSLKIRIKLGVMSSTRLREEDETTIYHIMYHFFGICKSNIDNFISWLTQTVEIPVANFDRVRHFLELLFSNISREETQELKLFCRERMNTIKKQNMLWMHMLAQPGSAPNSFLSNASTITKIKAPTSTDTVEFLQLMNGFGKRKSRTKNGKKSKGRKNKRSKKQRSKK